MAMSLFDLATVGQQLEKYQSAKSKSLPIAKACLKTPAEHKMKRMHEAKIRRIAEALAAGLNAAVQQGKPIK